MAVEAGMARRQVTSLFELRELCSMKQAELAERMAVSQSTISKLERRNDPSLEALRGYVGALGGEIEVLIHIDDRSYEYVGGANEPPRSR